MPLYNRVHVYSLLTIYIPEIVLQAPIYIGCFAYRPCIFIHVLDILHKKSKNCVYFTVDEHTIDNRCATRELF